MDHRFPPLQENSSSTGPRFHEHAQAHTLSENKHPPGDIGQTKYSIFSQLPLQPMWTQATALGHVTLTQTTHSPTGWVGPGVKTPQMITITTVGICVLLSLS